MKISPLIVDGLKAFLYLTGIILLIVIGISVYDAVHFSESEQINGFVSIATAFHAQLDLDEVNRDFLNMVDVVKNDEISDPLEMDFHVARSSSVVRNYRETFYSLMPPTDEMLVLRESLIQEANYFISAYYYLGEAWDSKMEGDYETYSTNMQKAAQNFDTAVSLRAENQSNLDYWLAAAE